MPTAFLTRKTHEYADVYTFRFRQPEVRYRAGMYAHLQVGSFFSRDGMRRFSIASAPHEDELAFVAHVDTRSGFKRRLAALQPGDTAKVYGIAGHIGLPKSGDRPIQFIAGGVGMAPFRSLILTAALQGGYTMSLLQVQRGTDFLYKEELAPLLDDYVSVAPERFLELVRNTAHAQPDALFYLCGSRRLVTGAREALASAEVSRRNLRIENFR
ncbi:MAG: FAD-dependent oxidoreductase [Bifidobacteriaceae bacterium]|jgi:ferredoxin-NADP reductase|nr:FAD-dependent oxidoreductase [Bifidobacteriaceae bacterium]